ncbi:MAG: PH domain-containing protein [Prevotellaceae bacterium]|nr:PH domain-containing protein [Prevotellaceae bacterium]
MRKGNFANGIRTFGSGGLFGYLGKFENPQLGEFEMYATDSKNRFLVETQSKTYVFSCKDRDKLIRLFKR